MRDALESCLANQQRALDRLLLLHDAQVQHALLRHCLDGCKVQWVLRTAPALLHPETLARGDLAIRSAFARIVGSPLSESQWRQACLPMRHGGMGIRTPSNIAAVARVAAMVNWHNHSPEDLNLIHTNSVRFADHTTLLETLTSLFGEAMDPLPMWHTGSPFLGGDPIWSSQKWWTDLASKRRRTSFLAQLEDRDQVRVHHQSGPLATAWMAA